MVNTPSFNLRSLYTELFPLIQGRYTDLSPTCRCVPKVTDWQINKLKQPCPRSSWIVKHFSFTPAELEWTRLLRRPALAGPYLFCCKADKAKKPICLVNIVCISLPDTRACKHMCVFEWQWEQEPLPLLYRLSGISLWFQSYHRWLDHAFLSLRISDVFACRSFGPLLLQLWYFTLQ